MLQEKGLIPDDLIVAPWPRLDHGRDVRQEDVATLFDLEEDKMLQEKVFVQDESVAISRAYPGYTKDLHREEVLRVLERAAQDNGFIAQLTHRGHEALQGYDLTWRERAALLSGDIHWIEARLGKLDSRLRTWLDCRLQQEKW